MVGIPSHRKGLIPRSVPVLAHIGRVKVPSIRFERRQDREKCGLPPHLLYRVRLTLLETSWEVSFIQTASPPFVLAISDPAGYHDDIVHIIARACGNVNRFFEVKV